MSTDDFRGDFKGIVPDPPIGTPTETATEAWKMAYVARAVAVRAEQKVTNSLTGQMRLFEEYGSLQASIANYFKNLNERFDDLEKRIGKKVDEAASNADEARTSSHDLQSELEEMETLLKNIKDRAVDSVKVKSLVDERVEVVVSKTRLAELEKAAADAKEDAKTRAAEKRNFKLTVYGLVIAGIIGMVATHFFEKAVAPATISNATQQSR